MRVTAKYTGFDPAFTRGATYSFELKTSLIGNKIKLRGVERSNRHIKLGTEVDHLDMIDFLCSWQIQKLTLTPAESNVIALRDDQHYGRSWLDRV